MYILWIHNKQIKTLQPHIKKLLKTSLKRRHNEAALPQIGTCSILARVCKGITSKYTSEQQGLQQLKRINISSSGFFKKKHEAEPQDADPCIGLCKCYENAECFSNLSSFYISFAPSGVAVFSPVTSIVIAFQTSLQVSNVRYNFSSAGFIIHSY